ncbi:hypothetical protein L2E82_38885 [Cichorium intybus]|uniref:Uncharacterized protein n=1 Tax=Cichorium intybus TaxID=13427 RepID=A0ACB9AHC0_CICIN|nr:hypothetical protein L2E82_38885 [Cichorium intybus]
MAVLTACSHSGLIDYGIKIFNSMFRKHGIKPLLDHYICVIHSLGRDGRFDEVEGILDNMSCVNDPILWEVLVSSCRVDDNVKLAKRAAEELFRLNPCNSTPYVLLANMYSSLGRWDDVRKIRELMVENKAVKNPGYSWVENKDGVREFNVDDKFRVVDKFDERYCLSG